MNKIIHPSNKTIFPLNSRTMLIGKMMLSYDYVILFNGISRVPCSIAVSFNGVAVHLMTKARHPSALPFFPDVIVERFNNPSALSPDSDVFPPTAAEFAETKRSAPSTGRSRSAVLSVGRARQR